VEPALDPDHLAATEGPRPEERVDGVLQPAEYGLRGAHVLVEAELASGFQDPPQLGEGGGRAREAAEHPEQERCVECPVLRRQRLGVAVDPDRHRGVPCARAAAAARAVASGSTASTCVTSGR